MLFARCDHVYHFLCLGGEPVPVVIRWSEVTDGKLLK